jgi:hypothetical protein
MCSEKMKKQFGDNMSKMVEGIQISALASLLRPTSKKHAILWSTPAVVPKNMREKLNERRTRDVFEKSTLPEHMPRAPPGVAFAAPFFP